MKPKQDKRTFKSIENFQCNGDAVSNQSALLFRARAILKNTYLQYNLLTEEEKQTGIVMPEDNFLLVIPRLESEGLNAAAEFLKFTSSGICVNNTEGGYSHCSREKLALLFIICNAELEKPLTGQFLIIDELKSIRKLSELVDWISNAQNEKDVRRVLEKENSREAKTIHPKPMEEQLLSKKELADRLRVSTKTIDRHKQKYKYVEIGSRTFFKYSDWVTETKPNT